MKRFVPTICLGFISLSAAFWPGSAFAHSVLTDYRLVADMLEVQSVYSTGEALAEADVVIYAPNDPTQPWLKGKTDPDGKFQFQPDTKLAGEWTVRIGETGDHGDLLSVPVNAAGIELDKITRAPFDRPHELASAPKPASEPASKPAPELTAASVSEPISEPSPEPSPEPASGQTGGWGRQILLTGVLLSGGLGVRWLTRWRRLGR